MTKKNEKLIKRFNKKYPVGSSCPMRSVNKPDVPFTEHKVRHEAYDMNGQPVAFFEGKSGCYSIEPGFVSYS